MTAYTAINLDRLPAPEFIAQPAFEEILAERKARLIELAPELAAALELESEPLLQILEEDSYRILHERQAVQDAAKGNLLAYAIGPQLDHLAAFYGVARQVVQEADPGAVPPVPEILEDDARFRARIQLAPEGFTTAGSQGSYIFWALSASPEVKDVSAEPTATPGEVLITVLSTDADGAAGQDLLDQVFAVLDERRPLCSEVTVQSATIQLYSVEAVLTLFEGPDAEVVRQEAQTALQAYIGERHRLGHDVTIAGIHAALWNDGVQNITLTSPVADIVIGSGEAAFCQSIDVTVGGRNV